MAAAPDARAAAQLAAGWRGYRSCAATLPPASRAPRHPGDLLERTPRSHRPRLRLRQVKAGRRFSILHLHQEPGLLLASAQAGEGESTFQFLAVEPDRNVAVA